MDVPRPASRSTRCSAATPSRSSSTCSIPTSSAVSPASISGQKREPLPPALARRIEAPAEGAMRRCRDLRQVRARVPGRLAQRHGGAPRRARSGARDRPRARGPGARVRQAGRLARDARAADAGAARCRRRRRRSTSSAAASTTSNPAGPGRCSTASPRSGPRATTPSSPRFESWCNCVDTATERAAMKRMLDDRNPQLAAVDRQPAQQRHPGVRRGRQPAHDRPEGAAGPAAPARLPGRAGRFRALSGRGSRAGARAGLLGRQSSREQEPRQGDTRWPTRAASRRWFRASTSCRTWSRTPARRFRASARWVAPTLDPAELEKRIDELRTVQFWLEQNARMLATTIQALEVQKMTLSTLKTMNVQMGDLRESLKLKPLVASRLPPRRRRKRRSPAAKAEPPPAAWSIRCSGGARSPASSPSSRPRR